MGNDPNKPEDSVLVTGSDMTNVKEMAIWVLMLAVSIVLVAKG